MDTGFELGILLPAILLAAAFLVAFLFSSRLQSVISDPILHLADTARLVSIGGNSSIRATKQSEEYIAHVKEQAMETPTNTAVTDMFNVVSRGDFLPGLAKMDKPVLYICEEQLASQGKVLQAAVPKARVEVMKSVAHALFVDDAENFNRLVAEFARSNR